MTCAPCFKGEPHCRAITAHAAAGEMTLRDRTVRLEWTWLVLPWSFEQKEGFQVARTTKGTNTVLTSSLTADSVRHAISSSSNNDNNQD